MVKYNKCKKRRAWEEAERADVALRTARSSGVKEDERTSFSVVPRDSGLSVAFSG